mmetsp:Transcript_28144/g.59967  ORF Transcript_28144/g.59967 Transcript_28144/m.59967 type:complete len:120 (+) Transcript_28144:962-1321(+)
MGVKGSDKFRKCVVMGQISGGDEEGDGDAGGEESGSVKIVQQYTIANKNTQHVIRHPAAKTSLPSSPPLAISTPPALPNLVKSAMARPVSVLASSVMPTVPNSRIVPSSSSPRAIAMEC